MRSQRNKQFDWSKPFKLISSQSQFQQIQTGQDILLTIPTVKQQQVQKQNYKKQNIITPKIQILPRVTSVKSFAKITPNYVRLSARLNLPRLIDYQLTQVDHVFIKTHSNKFKFKAKNVLTEQFLVKVFIALQQRAGKESLIPRSKRWINQFIQKYYKQLIQWQNLQVFGSIVYNFWKNRREYARFPLLRSLWRPNSDQFNHLLAFKPRQKQKRNLRKTTRISQDQILGQLYDQFQIVKQITERVQIRQQLRLKYLMTQLSIFHNQCKGLFGVPDFISEINSNMSIQSRLKDKQKVKQCHQRLDKLKNKREDPYQLNEISAPIISYQHQVSHLVQQQQNQLYDQKLSIACFLSTVICEAQVFGINYGSIYQSKLQPQQQIIQPMLPIEKQQQLILKQQPYVNMSLYKQGDMIIRDFQVQNDYNTSQSQSSFNIEINNNVNNYEFSTNYLNSQFNDIQQNNNNNNNNNNVDYTDNDNKKIIRNRLMIFKNKLIINNKYKRCHQDVIDYSKSKVTGYYIGDDDQFEGKDLRKNIAGSFKKFQMQFRQN